MPFSFAGEIRVLSVWQFGILLGRSGAVPPPQQACFFQSCFAIVFVVPHGFLRRQRFQRGPATHAGRLSGTYVFRTYPVGSFLFRSYVHVFEPSP